MGEALCCAADAARRDEVPVGAAVVLDGRLVACAGNASIAEHDPSGHAEIRALRAAGTAVRNYRLTGATLYVTVEPCAMCLGAALHARVGRVVFGVADPKAGAAGSLYDLASDPRHNHRIAVTSGVRDAECREMLQAFFRARRGSRAPAVVVAREGLC